MRPFFKQFSRQQGLALLIILVIVVLGAMTVLVSGLNSTDINIAKQKQTMLALAQAKSALLGFAATYAETHPGQPVGYLPCPDLTGDGSADTSCSEKEKSVLGRFPWRTLGLPPLRDGDGECLWYAVSGNYKDAPKVTLTSDTNGLFTVRDVNGNITAGNAPENRAIAIIFAPGKIVGTQDHSSSGGNECSSGPSTNYLDSLASINNAQGTDDSAITGEPGEQALPTSDLSVFINAPSSSAFNDTLMLITPQDYQSIYTRMDLWVLEKIRSSNCIKAKSSEGSYNHPEGVTFPKYLTAIGDWNDPLALTYRKTYESQIDKYVNIAKLKYRAKFHKEYKDEFPTVPDPSVPDPSTIATEEAGNEARRKAIDVDEKRLPWAAKLEDAGGDVNYADSEGERFGRIPKTLNATANSGRQDMANSWPKDCFSWGEEWREMVFYAIDAHYAPDSDILPYFWVKATRTKYADSTCVNYQQEGTCLPKSDGKTNCLLKNDVTGTSCWESWVAWLTPPFDEVTESDTNMIGGDVLTGTQTTQIKNDTLARLEPSLTSWCKVVDEPDEPDECVNPDPTTSQLKLDGKEPFSYVILVAGRRLHLNSDSTDAITYPDYPQVRDSVAEKIEIKNYLEGEEHPDRKTDPKPSNKLRKMTGGNIPQTGEADTIPPGNEDFFGIKKPVEFDYFNDVAVACIEGKDCEKSFVE